ncbi:hypothetical protein LAZ67_19000412 [Cordylochernes scorpioides]|uniref:Uncharacterized protein n=1 Tax=Cordylochernes scorpioides TaxID=51811 RepID=A0ABY6LKW9_9ARAC|nr:hypothetical protein LAZ67_19000412 [Cordylochernes scorpioides]
MAFAAIFGPIQEESTDFVRRFVNMDETWVYSLKTWLNHVPPGGSLTRDSVRTPSFPQSILNFPLVLVPLETYWESVF